MAETGAQPAGRFVVIEGPDGAGKTTQVAALAAALAGSGREVVTCRDPGGTALGERLRALVKDRSDVAIGIRAEMFLFMASRAEMVDQVIRPALERGAVVVADRFVLSNVVYQGLAGGLDEAEVRAVGRVATGGLVPDLTVILEVGAGVARERIGPGRDRIESRGDSYQDRVRRGYREASGREPGPVVVVDGSADPATVAAQVRSEVERALAFAART